MDFPFGASDKEPTCQCRRHRRHGFNPWVGKIPLEEGMATHSSILARRIPWTEEPGGLQSMGLHRVGHGWSDLAPITYRGAWTWGHTGTSGSCFPTFWTCCPRAASFSSRFSTWWQSGCQHTWACIFPVMKLTIHRKDPFSDDSFSAAAGRGAACLAPVSVGPCRQCSDQELEFLWGNRLESCFFPSSRGRSQL